MAFVPSATSTPLVLIADDDQDLLDVTADALSIRGYRVATARNGREALDRLEVELPQLILLDMSMPVMDGWEFTKVLRERHGRKIPLVVTTAAMDSQLRADEVGAAADLGKPFELEELYAVVEDTLAGGGP